MSADDSEVSPKAGPVSDVINAILREGPHDELIKNRLANARVEEAAAAIIEDSHSADEILTALFPEGVPIDESFYDKLAHVEYKIGHQTGAHQLIGLLWARAFTQLTNDNGRHLLDALSQRNSRAFFTVLYALPTFLKHCSLQADFLSGWIVAVRTRLGNDGASGGFWDALQTLATATPQLALQVASQLGANPPEENTITIAANLLGHLRARTLNLSGFSALEILLRDHQHVDRRLIYHRSWITTGLHRALTDQEFLSSIELMSNGTKEEVDEAFNVLRVLLPLPSTSDESFLFGTRWLHKRTTNGVSAFWKHFLVSLARQLHERWDKLGRPIGIPPLSDLVIVIQPIPDENVGTWHELEELLVFLSNHDSDAFHHLFFELARKNPDGLSKRLKDHEGLHDLRSAMMKQEVQTIVEALLSDDTSIRHVGFSLFDAFGVHDLTHQLIDKASDDRIALLIFAFQLEPFYDEVIPRFLLALEPRIRKGSASLQQLLIEELVFQSKNLPGACLKALKERTSESETVKRAVQEAENYFDALKPCFRSAINSMGIPGLDRAIRVKAARQAREMRTHMNKVSIFSQLCTTSYTLYGGTKWQTFVGGKLGEVSGMQQISHSAELPRMPGIDPEGIALRRFNATRMIRALLSREESATSS